MSQQRNSSARPNAATIFVALVAGLATNLSPVNAQDRPLSADFPEVYRVGGLAAPDWAQFTERGDLGFDASGNLYVLDAEAFRVVVINSAGELVRTVGQRGEGPGDFRDPTALVVWRDGRFAVADGDRWAIQVFGGDGSHDHYARMNTEFRPFQLQQLTLQRRMKPHPDGVSLYAQGASYANRAIASWGTHPDSMGVDDRTIERFDVSADRVVAETALQGWRAQRESPRESLPDELESEHILRVFLDDMILEPKFYWDVLPDGTLAYSDSSADARGRESKQEIT